MRCKWKYQDKTCWKLYALDLKHEKIGAEERMERMSLGCEMLNAKNHRIIER